MRSWQLDGFDCCQLSIPPRKAEILLRWKMNEKPADQTHDKLCQRISELNKIDVCLHSSSHKQAVCEFSFFPYREHFILQCVNCFLFLQYGIHVSRKRGKELKQPFSCCPNVCLFCLDKFSLNIQQE